MTGWKKTEKLKETIKANQPNCEQTEKTKDAKNVNFGSTRGFPLDFFHQKENFWK
jgi:hypothetical protein